MLYPMKFEDTYKGMPRYIWGGRNLAAIGKRLPNEGTVAESWEVSCNPAGLSVISNGQHKGEQLISVVNEFWSDIVGGAKTVASHETVADHNAVADHKAIAGSEKFPLLIKFIDANDDLSVQVHPGDEYAQSAENEAFGKNEMWYIVAANPGAKLIYDIMPGTTKESFKLCIEENKVMELLQTVYVSPGDFINIPAGVVHAIGKGIVLAEIQQNSDLTYRLFDFDRIDPNGNPRPLHIEKALDVINFGAEAGARKTKFHGLALEPEPGNSRTIAIANKYFAVEKLRIRREHKGICDGNKFFILTGISGRATIKHEGGTTEFASGESVLLPARLGAYTVEGDITYLKSYVPDIGTDIEGPLIKAGFSRQNIIENIGGMA